MGFIDTTFMDNPGLIPHLFRTEYRKIVSVLCRRFGFDHIETAEDLASETFLVAAQTWGFEGLPENPTAWLYAVARNKAKNYLQRDAFFRDTVAPELQNSTPIDREQEIDLSPHNISDSQLRMMFVLCHPSIPPESQIGLSLRILCGFGIEEIADAFLTNKETINKRLFRAKEILRKEMIAFELPSAMEIDNRLETVLKTIYLLFNEGYYSVSGNSTLRMDLCLEALRLCTMLTENENTNKPQVNALLALMCFHASRFEARTGQNGELILYQDQDEQRWNAELITRGGIFLQRAITGSVLSKYHLEATIAFWNTNKSDTQEKWENILQLYNQLLQIEYSPIAALNRTYALSKVRGKEEAIGQAEKLNLTENQFYFMLLGELYSGINDDEAQRNLRRAFAIAKTDADKQIIQKKLDSFQ